jgi:hypothetical protein
MGQTGIQTFTAAMQWAVINGLAAAAAAAAVCRCRYRYFNTPSSLKIRTGTVDATLPTGLGYLTAAHTGVLSLQRFKTKWEYFAVHCFLISGRSLFLGKWQPSSVCPGKSNVQVRINTEHWCNRTKINPLTPELNPFALRCLTRFFTGDFSS